MEKFDHLTFAHFTHTRTHEFKCGRLLTEQSDADTEHQVHNGRFSKTFHPPLHSVRFDKKTDPNKQTLYVSRTAASSS